MQFQMIDTMSAEYQQDMQRLNALRTQVVLWLVVLALAIVLIPLMLIAGWVRNDVARLENELLAVQSALNSATSPSGEVAQIRNEIAAIEQLVSTMQTVTLPSGVNWPIVIGAVADYDAAAIQLAALTQSEEKVQLTGRATHNDAVVRYQQALLDSAAFSDVVVVSMIAAPPVAKDEAKNDAKANAPDEDENAASLVEPPFGAVEFVIDLFVNQTMGSDTP